MFGAEWYKEINNLKIQDFLSFKFKKTETETNWPDFSSDLKRWLQSCEMCARRKPDSGCEKSPLQQEISYQPLDRIALDIFGPLNITENGNQYILVVSDWYTTYTVAYALRDHAAVTVANKLVT